MDGSSSRTQHPEITRTDSSGDLPREHTERDKMNVDTRSAQPMSAMQRSSRYKEKFHSLREKYEQVMSTHERYEKALAIANKKLKDLQNECNLLLDAVDIAVPGQPTLQHFLNFEPVPPYMASAPSMYGGGPPPPIVHTPQPSHEPSPLHTPQPLPALPRSNSHNTAPQTNGVNGH